MSQEKIFIREPGKQDGASRPCPSVTPAAAWLAALAMAAAIIGAAVWAFVGTSTDSVELRGIVFPQAGIEQINSPVEGIVSYTTVEVGEQVQEGDLLAVVPQTALLEQIEDALERAALPEERTAARQELEELYSQYQAASMIYSTVSGRVVDLVQKGASVQPGDQIARITNANTYSNDAEIRAYIPMNAVQFIKKGMEVRVYPQTALNKQYSYIPGLVSDISTYPITDTDIQAALGRFYTSSIIPQGGNIAEVRVTLLAGTEDAALQWSQAEGSNLSVDTGTLCTMEVIFSEMTPWESLSK